jgi:tripartite-type tricarboxylate transporter receptor subunit TctC
LSLCWGIIIGPFEGGKTLTMPRTNIWRAAVAVLLLAIAICPAAAEEWPTKPVRLLVLVPAGNAPDITGRLVADKLSAAWGQRVLVDNRPGAGGIIGMTALKQAGDGHTLALVQASVIVTTPYMYKDPQFDVDKDLEFVAMVGYSPMMMVANPAFPATSLRELIELAKAQPGKITLAVTGGAVSVPHLAGEMLAHAAGIQLYVVPFTGSAAALTAVAGNDAQLMVDGVASLESQAKAGSVRPLITLSKARLPHRPDLPAASETLPGFDATGWFVLVAPRGMPDDVVQKIHDDMDKVAVMPDIIARLSDLGIYPEPMSLPDLNRFVQAERKSWEAVIRTIGVKPQ